MAIRAEGYADYVENNMSHVSYEIYKNASRPSRLWRTRTESWDMFDLAEKYLGTSITKLM